MINIAIIGCGHWGPNYVRVLSKLKEVKVTCCCDLKDSNLEKIKELNLNIVLVKDYHSILADKNIQAVIVATPANTHYQIVKDCLEQGKDVLAEKPLTLIAQESLELANLAEKNSNILMVGHTFLFNPGIIKLKEYIRSGELGKIYYINAVRTHLGLIREDVNAIWDLAPHDISICNYLTDSLPTAVNAVATSYLKKSREDMSFINLIYPDNIIAHIHVSWIDSNKERTIKVVGSKARVVFNDLDNLERVKIYNKGVGVSERYNDFGQFQLNLRDGDIISPMLNLYEPLTAMCTHFVNCLINRAKPITDGYQGYNIVRIVKAIERSLQNNSQMEQLAEQVASNSL